MALGSKILGTKALGTSDLSTPIPDQTRPLGTEVLGTSFQESMVLDLVEESSESISLQDSTAKVSQQIVEVLYTTSEVATGKVSQQIVEVLYTATPAAVPSDNTLATWEDRVEWKVGMDANMLILGRAFGQFSIIDRDLSSPPGSPTDGDKYIVASGASGAWTSQEDNVVVWDGSQWIFYAPSVGWLGYLVDEQKLTVFKTGSGWSTGIAI